MKDVIKVLVCDNNTDKGGLETLASLGLKVETCEKSGAAVIENVKATSPDVVVMEVYMPVFDAIAVMERIRNECQRPPVFIVTTGYDSNFINNEVMSKGASYMMLMPYDFKALGERIISLMSSKTPSKGQETPI